jgi:hypothetical protein
MGKINWAAMEEDGKAPLISEESAEKQLKILLVRNDIKMSGFDAKTLSAVEMQLGKIKSAVMDGTVEVVEKQDGSVIVEQTLKSGTKLQYKELLAGDKVAMGGAENSGYYEQLYRSLGKLTGIGSAGIEKLYGKDLRIAEALGLLFLLA